MNPETTRTYDMLADSRSRLEDQIVALRREADRLEIQRQCIHDDILALITRTEG